MLIFKMAISLKQRSEDVVEVGLTFSLSHLETNHHPKPQAGSSWEPWQSLAWRSWKVISRIQVCSIPRRRKWAGWHIDELWPSSLTRGLMWVWRELSPEEGWRAFPPREADVCRPLRDERPQCSSYQSPLSDPRSLFFCHHLSWLHVLCRQIRAASTFGVPVTLRKPCLFHAWLGSRLLRGTFSIGVKLTFIILRLC